MHGQEGRAIPCQRFSCATFVYARVTVVSGMMLITSAMLPFAAFQESNEQLQTRLLNRGRASVKVRGENTRRIHISVRWHSIEGA